MQTPSSPSVKITYFDKAKVGDALKRYVASIRLNRPEVKRIVLFGSMARGDTVPGSDVDLLIILAYSDKPFLGRMTDFVPDRFPVGIDVFAYTEQEIEKMSAEGNSLVRRALAEGKVLFDAGKAA